MAFGFTYTLPTITGTHAGFPVVLKAVDFPTGAKDGGASSVDNGGGNLRAYTDSGKGTQLPLEVVRFVTGGTPDIEVWVRIDSASTGATIYLEADAVAVSQPAATDTYGRNAVWQDYHFVGHMEGLPSTTITDSSGNQDATSTSNVLQTTGVIGDGGETDDANDNQLATVSGLTVSSGMAISAWMRIDSYSGGSALPSVGINETDKRFYIGAFEGTGTLFGGYGTRSLQGPAYTLGTTKKLAVYIDSGTAYFQVDGGTPISNTGTFTGSSTLTVGVTGRNASPTNPIDGMVDEVRVRKAASNLTASQWQNWEATEYANQTAATAWGTVGTWADSGGGTTITGSGSHQAQPATHTGTGERVITGSAAHQASTATHTGTGERVITGAGTHQSVAATHAGTGERVITGTGSHQAQAATHTGTGIVVSDPSIIIGSGAHQAQNATHTGLGDRVIAGSGSHQARQPGDSLGVVVDVSLIAADSVGFNIVNVATIPVQ